MSQFHSHFSILWISVLILVRCARADPPAQPTGQGALIIVAPAALLPALDEFVRHKATVRPTRLVSLEDALAAGATGDDPERLKRFLYEAWSRTRNEGSVEPLRYALLVGDADVMPVRYMALDRVTTEAFDYAFYPSDLYYADLARQDGTFDDWNAARGDGTEGSAFHASYYGEVRGEKNKSDPMNYDSVDYRPDIAVGRWPASTPEAVRIVVQKTIAYEQRIQNEDGAAARDAALLAVGGWVENRPQMDDIAGALSPTWTVQKRYWSDPDGAAQTPRPDEAGAVALINAGIDLVLHSGHGSDWSWAESLQAGSIERLTNAARPAIMMSAGCSTARLATLPPYEGYEDVDGVAHKGTVAGEVFTAPPSAPSPYQKGAFNPSGLGERLLIASANGAVVYIGCNTGSQPCGMTLLAGFARAAGAPGAATVGDCWVEAVARYYDAEHLSDLKPTSDWYPASIFFQGMKFVYFGDPSVPWPRGGKPSIR